MSNKYKIIFDDYVSTVFTIETDIRFWKHFLDAAIEKYQKENPEDRWINQAGFSIYNYTHQQNMWLHSSEQVKEIYIANLGDHSKEMFVWIMNLSLVRVYNAVELLLLRAIQHHYFTDLEDPIKGRKEANKVKFAIKQTLKSANLNVDTTNERYLIDFISANSPTMAAFLKAPVNQTNWKVTWRNYFELFAILRNIVTHQSMMLTVNVVNGIKAIAGDIFNHYFYFDINKNDPEILTPCSSDYFLNFIHHMNDFSGNTLKFVAGESDLEFIGMTSA